MGWFFPSKAKKLWQAAYHGDEAELRRLIDLGGDVNWHNPWVRRRMCLAWAPAVVASVFAYGHEGCVRLLLQSGATINVTTTYGWSALHGAAYEGYLAIAKRLLEGGADVTLRDKWGDTALDDARKKGKSEVVALLSEPRWDKTGAAKAAADKAAADKAEAAWISHKPTFYFLPRAAVLGATATQLKRMQELRDSKLLEKMAVDLNEAFQGTGLIQNILFVSH
eukprot:jgi/Chrpa1/23114/Chrysochromulina_OHIO_Genome00024486-RA